MECVTVRGPRLRAAPPKNLGGTRLEWQLSTEGSEPSAFATLGGPKPAFPPLSVSLGGLDEAKAASRQRCDTTLLLEQGGGLTATPGPVPTVCVGYLYIPKHLDGVPSMADELALAADLPAFVRLGRAAAAALAAFVGAHRLGNNVVLTASAPAAIRLSSGQTELQPAAKGSNATTERSPPQADLGDLVVERTREPHTSRAERSDADAEEPTTFSWFRKRAQRAPHDVIGVVVSVPLFWGLMTLRHLGKGQGAGDGPHVALLSDVEERGPARPRPRSALALAASVLKWAARRSYSEAAQEALRVSHDPADVPIWTLPSLRLYQYVGGKQLVRFTPALLSLRTARQLAEGHAALQLRRALRTRAAAREARWRGLEERLGRDWVGGARAGPPREEGLEPPPEVEQMMEEIVSDLAADPAFLASVPWGRALQSLAGMATLGMVSAVGGAGLAVLRAADAALAATGAGRRRLGLEALASVGLERRSLGAIVRECSSFNAAQEEALRAREGSIAEQQSAAEEPHVATSHAASPTNIERTPAGYRASLAVAALSLAAMTPPLPQPLLEGPGAPGGPLCVFQGGQRGLSSAEMALLVDRLRRSEFLQRDLLGGAECSRGAQLHEMMELLETQAGPLLLENLHEDGQSGLQQPSRELGASVVGQGILLLGGADHPLPALARSVAVEDLAQLAPAWKVDDTREI